MFDFLKRLVKKESKTAYGIYMSSRQAEWSKREYANYAKEGYSKCVVAYQAVNKRAESVAAIPYVIKNKRGKPITDNPYLDLIKNPNPSQSREELIESIVGFYSLAGNSYIEKTMFGRTPKELYPLRPDRMCVLPGSHGPAGYKYKTGGYEASFPVDKNGNSDILHLRTFNPLDDWYGLSPIEVAAYDVDVNNESKKHIMSLLQNGMVPSGALTSQDELSDEAYNILKNEMQENFSGSRNTGRPLLLQGGLKWEAMGITPSAANLIETKYSSARDVSLALGVPPLLLNIPGDATYSNYTEARLAFYEETVVPLATRICNELNAWLSPYFNGLRLELDLDHIPAMVEKRQKLWDMANLASDLTINERRALRGYEPVEGGDEVYISSANVPLSMDAMPATEGTVEDAEADADKAYGKR